MGYKSRVVPNVFVCMCFSVFCANGFRKTDLSAAGTHMAPLMTVVAHTTGPILELGCGDFSTPLLHAACSGSQRLLVTTENNKMWMNYFLDMANNWHKFILVNDWNKIGNDTHWSVVFVDNAPGGQRIVDIARLRKNTDIFVAHDTEDVFYNYNSILPTFKYRYTYKRYPVTTTVVSDVIDVRTFFG